MHYHTWLTELSFKRKKLQSILGRILNHFFWEGVGGETRVGLNSGPRDCEVDTILLETLHQPFFVLGVFKSGS
jgi:hypothetical protein